MPDVNEIVGAYKQAISATEYVDALVCEMNEIDSSNNDYEMVWTTQYSGEFPPHDD